MTTTMIDELYFFPIHLHEPSLGDTDGSKFRNQTVEQEDGHQQYYLDYNQSNDDNDPDIDYCTPYLDWLIPGTYDPSLQRKATMTYVNWMN